MCRQGVAPMLTWGGGGRMYKNIMNKIVVLFHLTALGQLHTR